MISIFVVTLANTWWFMCDIIETIGIALDEQTWDDTVMRLYRKDIDD